MKDKEETRKDIHGYYAKAKKYAWITIGYLVFDATILYIVMQNSQALKAAWFEDMLFLVPSISFLVGTSFIAKPANKTYRFGFNKAYSVGFLAASVALLTVGSYLFFESVYRLVIGEVITIGTTHMFGETIWFGWLMIAAAGYSIIPVYIIGKKKINLARKLNSQILYTDAQGQKADWLTSVATIAGVIGVGFGLWWADSAAAIIIAFEILSDGITNLKTAIAEIMDRVPLSVDLKEDPVVDRVERLVQEEDWVKDSLVRLKMAGNKVKGEVLVIPKGEDGLLDKVVQLAQKIDQLSWETSEIMVSPVKELPEIYEKKI